MFVPKYFFLFFFLFSNALFAQNLELLKTKILNNEVLRTDVFSEPFDSAGNWTGEAVQDSLILLHIRDKKDSLETFILDLFKNNGMDLSQKMALAHLAAYLGYEKALEPIWEELIGTFRIYGWEGPNYDLIDSYLEDVQYPFQQYYWACLSALLKKNPAKSLKNNHYQRLEKSLTTFLDKYAQETFLPTDSTFDLLAWHYVLMKKIDSTNVFVLKINTKLEKRQVWALILKTDSNLAEAEFEYEKWLKQNPNISKNFLTIYKTTIKGKIRYKTTIFCSSETEALNLQGKLKKAYSDFFIFRLPCYPPRRSAEGWQVYQCEEF